MKNLEDVKYFVFSSGKTGSKILVDSISKNFGVNSTVHVHSSQHFKDGHPRYGDVKQLMIDNSKKFNKIYIIDSYREPFERGISSFFHHINKHCPEWKSMSVDQIIDHYNQNYLYLLELYHSYHESWGYFNIPTDVTFDFEKGYITKEYENMVFVKTRLKESYRWNSIFSEIFKKRINFISTNKGENKFYNEVYKEFKNKYRLPEKVKENFLNTFNGLSVDNVDLNKFKSTIIEMKKFMTDQEIDDYLKKWIF